MHPHLGSSHPSRDTMVVQVVKLRLAYFRESGLAQAQNHAIRDSLADSSLEIEERHQSPLKREGAGKIANGG